MKNIVVRKNADFDLRGPAHASQRASDGKYPVMASIQRGVGDMLGAGAQPGGQ